MKEIDEIHDRIINGYFSENMKDSIINILRKTSFLNKKLAVRSSFSCEDSKDVSFVVIFESYLNVNGIEQLLMSLKKFFASLITSKSMHYMLRMDRLKNDVNVSVVMMEMVDAQCSGVCFTCNPSENNDNEIIINANYGLGESIC